MDDKQCLIVIIDSTEDAKKELVDIDGGFRENDLSWTQLLNDLKSRGLEMALNCVLGQSRFLGEPLPRHTQTVDGSVAWSTR